MFFRPSDSTPLNAEEDQEWLDMESMGRARYIRRRAIQGLNYMIIPVVVMVWGVWWFAPASRPFLLDRLIWIPMAIGVVIVGSLVTAHAWDTWRSYERRSQIDDEGHVIASVPQREILNQTKERVE